MPAVDLWGYESFGTLRDDVGIYWPGGIGVSGSDTGVKLGDGTVVQVGDGDYRWFVRVLRTGGTSGERGDYETWLGPVVRFVGS